MIYRADDYEAVCAVVDLLGPVVPVAVAAFVWDVDRSRVYQLIDEGRLDRVLVGGALMVAIRGANPPQAVDGVIRGPVPRVPASGGNRSTSGNAGAGAKSLGVAKGPA